MEWRKLLQDARERWQRYGNPIAGTHLYWRTIIKWIKFKYRLRNLAGSGGAR
jgi:hypothetical protein